LNKTKSLFVVKPFYCSVLQSNSSFKDFTAPAQAGLFNITSEDL